MVVRHRSRWMRIWSALPALFRSLQASLASSPTDCAMGLVSTTASPCPPPVAAHAAARAPVADPGGPRRGVFELALPLRHAGSRQVRIAWEIAGPVGAPVVLVAGGISAHRHIAANAVFPEAGWANDLVGLGRTLDPARWRILGFDYLGADGRVDAPLDTA